MFILWIVMSSWLGIVMSSWHCRRTECPSPAWWQSRGRPSSSSSPSPSPSSSLGSHLGDYYQLVVNPKRNLVHIFVGTESIAFILKVLKSWAWIVPKISSDQFYTPFQFFASNPLLNYGLEEKSWTFLWITFSIYKSCLLLHSFSQLFLAHNY